MSLTTLHWRLEDFNGGQDLEPPTEDAPPAPVGDVEATAATADDSWMEGYLQALRHAVADAAPTYTKDALTVGLAQLEDRLRQAAEAATLLVANLLLKATLAAAGRDPAGEWQNRLRRIVDTIKPALLGTVPEIALHSENGETILTTTDIEGIAEDSGELGSCDGARVSWRLGRAAYSRRASMEEMAWALAPLIVNTVQLEHEDDSK